MSHITKGFYRNGVQVFFPIARKRCGRLLDRLRYLKQAGTGPRLKNSKSTSMSQLTVLEHRKSKKMDRVARRGPLARAPRALKGGHFRNIQYFCRS